MEITKRRYNKGFYVDRGSKVNKSENKIKSADQIVKKDENTIGNKIERVDNNTDNSISNITVKETGNTVISSTTISKEKKAKYALSTKGQKTNEQLAFSKNKLTVKKKTGIVNAIEKKENSDSTTTGGGVPLILLVILCFLLPPLAVWLAAENMTKLVISIILTLLFWIPGIIYALYIVLTS